MCRRLSPTNYGSCTCRLPITWAPRIAAGELAQGQRLPPERTLATEYGVVYNTVRRAMDVLRERGLIITMHGRGTYVARP